MSSEEIHNQFHNTRCNKVKHRTQNKTKHSPIVCAQAFFFLSFHLLLSLACCFTRTLRCVGKLVICSWFLIVSTQQEQPKSAGKFCFFSLPYSNEGFSGFMSQTRLDYFPVHIFHPLLSWVYSFLVLCDRYLLPPVFRIPLSIFCTARLWSWLSLVGAHFDNPSLLILKDNSV